MGDFDETGAEGTLALMNDAPPALSLSAGAQDAMAASGTEFRIPTTTRVFEQGFDSDTCCAHAVAAAIETRMVAANGLDAGAAPIDPMMIFSAGNGVRSIHVSRKVAEDGIPTAFGIERATSRYLGKRPIEALVEELQNNRPLVVEVRIDPSFATHDGADIYRPSGELVLHALCILGFGTDLLTGESYWIARNSYGADWGAAGYARLLWGDPFVKPESKVHVIQDVTP